MTLSTIELLRKKMDHLASILNITEYCHNTNESTILISDLSNLITLAATITQECQGIINEKKPNN